jgi:hypothetical protein
MLRFFSSLDSLMTSIERLYLWTCANCNKVGSLRRHSHYFRVDPKGKEPIHHGQRVFCSNRYKNKGCGKTFTLQISVKLPRLHHLTKDINDFLLHYSDSQNAIKSWKASVSYYACICQPYRLLSFIKKSLPKLKAALGLLTKPPDGIFANPVLQVIKQLILTSPNIDSPVQWLILHLQKRPF